MWPVLYDSDLIDAILGRWNHVVYPQSKNVQCWWLKFIYLINIQTIHHCVGIPSILGPVQFSRTPPNDFQEAEKRNTQFVEKIVEVEHGWFEPMRSVACKIVSCEAARVNSAGAVQNDLQST